MRSLKEISAEIETSKNNLDRLIQEYEDAQEFEDERSDLAEDARSEDACDDEDDEDDDPMARFEDMDGDHDSAMASAGWGTDEDYGCYNMGSMEDMN